MPKKKSEQAKTGKAASKSKPVVKRKTSAKKTTVSKSKTTVKKRRVTVSKPAVSVSEDDIRKAAYFNYVNRGGTNGNNEKDWYEAEKNLKKKRTRKTKKS
jgi:hypothetical protein